MPTGNLQPDEPFRKPQSELSSSPSVENWRDVLADAKCRFCDAGIGAWEQRRNVNNNGVYLACLACGESHPVVGVAFLRQGNKTRREPSPETTEQTWERCGDRCYHCTRTRDEITRMGLGIHQHHVRPYAEFGHSGLEYLVPLCAWCHEDASARQRYTAAVLRAMETSRA